jgi:hypothetical protein
VTRKGQVARVIPAAVLPRDDVLDVKGEIGIDALMSTAIRATLVGP